MRALDYTLYIIHSFLLIVRKLNNEDIEGRSKNALALILFFPSLLLLAIVYILGISNNLISYNKSAIFIFGIVLFLIIRYLIFKRYKIRYLEVVETLKKQFPYSTKTFVFSFFLLWLIPIFSFWFGNVQTIYISALIFLASARAKQNIRLVHDFIEFKQRTFSE